MKLSLCITTYNRYEMTIESFAQVLNDDRIDDIVIMDDDSENATQTQFAHFIWSLQPELGKKIKFLMQPKNVGMSRNKRDAIFHAKNEWCIIFDSDNIIDPTYLDAFYKYTLADRIDHPIPPRAIFCPDFAKPDFDYRAFTQDALTSGIYFAKDAARCIIDSRFNCLMNTCNYIVNRDYYLKTYQYNPDHIASDTIWHNYNHLKSGGEFAIVPDMQYFHRVHKDSGFMQDAAGNMARAEEVRKLIQQL